MATKNKLSVRKALGASFKTVWSILPSIFLFELVYKLLINVVLRPFLRWIIDLGLSLSGQPLAFNEQIRDFFLTSPFGWVAGLFYVVIAAIAIYFEFSVIIIMAYYACKGRRVRIRFAIKTALFTMKSLWSPGFIGFCLYSMVLLPFVNMGIHSSLIPSLSLPNFVSGELEKTVPGALGLLALIFVAAFVARQLIFVLPSMVLQRLSFGRALRAGFQMIRGTGIRIILVILLFILLWSLTLLPPVIVEVVLYGQGVLFGSAQVADNITLWQALLFILALLGSTLIQMVLAPLVLSVVVTLYNRLGGEMTLQEADVDAFKQKWENRMTRVFAPRSKNPDKKPFAVRHAGKLIALFISILLVVGLGNGLVQALALPLNNQAHLAIGHRGSHKGVENTLQAIQGAMDAKADYAEIDILLSSDGIPMVIHDDHLARLANQNLYVYDLTAEELGSLTLSQDGYTGKISTLEEVLRFCKDKQKLLIEFKQHGHEEKSVVEEVFKVVQQEGFEDSAIYHTLVYDFAQEAKQLQPDATVGYITYGSIGRVDVSNLQQLGVNFVVVEEGMFSTQLVVEGEKAGLDVFVWTVNDEEDMEGYYTDGATAVITDYPETARTVVDDIANDTLQNLFDDSSAAASVSAAAA